MPGTRSNRRLPGRHGAAVLLACALLFLFTDDAAAVRVWQGRAVVNTVTAACNNADLGPVRIDNDFRMVWRPKLIDGNGVDSRALFLEEEKRLFLVTLPQGVLPGGSFVGSGVDARAANRTSTGTYSNFIQTPADPQIATMNLDLKGRLTNFMFIPGCTINFSASLAQMPTGLTWRSAPGRLALASAEQPGPWSLCRNDTSPACSVPSWPQRIGEGSTAAPRSPVAASLDAIVSPGAAPLRLTRHLQGAPVRW